MALPVTNNTHEVHSMRTRSFTLLIAIALLAAAAGQAHAAAAPRTGAPHVAAYQQQVDQHDGSRVAVQLAVLGGAAVVVVVIGTAAYFLRKRLGLTAGPAEQPGEAHH
ncbi:MAG TPA: hypothetical protein VEZ14_01820 [Dehalococcoidia bacterium]|nr:hypothetical protein [Dehalococcoidia bacterium]